jgi:DNA-binding YbaB/EbfC family protein
MDYYIQKGGKIMARGGFPGGFPGMGNMNQLMKQAKKMQEQMAKLQGELEQKTIEASAGGGVVTVVANGKKEVVDIKIAPEAVDPDDIEMLQDLIMAAVNEALRQAEEMVQNEMNKITGGLSIPGLF